MGLWFYSICLGLLGLGWMWKTWARKHIRPKIKYDAKKGYYMYKSDRRWKPIYDWDPTEMIHRFSVHDSDRGLTYELSYTGPGKKYWNGNPYSWRSTEELDKHQDFVDKKENEIIVKVYGKVLENG